MRTKINLLCIPFFFAFSGIHAQIKSNIQTPVSINDNGSDPDDTAILDVQSTSKGMLVPRMTSTQRTMIASPAQGLLVFDTNSGSFWFFDGGLWVHLTSSGTTDQLADADDDTKIQVEESADEDVIRFDVAGIEMGRMDGKTFHLESPGNSLFIGSNAGQNDDGTDNRNTFIGNDAGTSNTTGFFNTFLFLGESAGTSNTSGSDNTFLGRSTGNSNTTGSYNTFLGQAAGYSNTFLGESAGNSNTTGFNNTFVGRTAGSANTDGSNNTFVGRSAGLANTTCQHLPGSSCRPIQHVRL